MESESANQLQEGKMKTVRRSLQGKPRGGRARVTKRQVEERSVGVTRGRVVRREGAVRRGRTLQAGARNIRQAEREEAAANVLERKKKQMREAIAAMSEQQVREILAQTVEREPTLIQDILELVSSASQARGSSSSTSSEGPSPAPGGSSQEDWCSCTNCREMPTEDENVCCGKQPETCISRLAQFQLLVLDEDVLDVARLYRQDVLAVPPDGDRNRGRRHAGYRQFTLWQHGRLGAGNRRIIPSCCVVKIRERYPDRFGQYTGFIPGRLG